jgi:hypothetical protein
MESRMPCALSPNLSNTLHSFSIVTPLPGGYVSHVRQSAPRTCIPYQRRASLQSYYDRGLTAVLQRPSSCTWRAAPRRSAVLTRPSKSTRKFGRRKYHKGHPVKGQWVFGGVESETGKMFLVPVTDKTADTYCRYRYMDRTRHYGHQWLLGCVPPSRRARLHTPHRQPQHGVR